MALSKLEKDMSIIQKLDDEPNDVGGLTAAELKAKFDEAGMALKEYLNETLLPELEEAGVLTILRTGDGTVLKYIRLNADKALETSADGESWESTASGGHLILDSDGYEMPQRARLRFANCEVTDDGEATVVGVDGSLSERLENAEGSVSALQQTAEAMTSRIEDAEGSVSEISQTVDNIKMSVAQTTGADGQVYSSIELTVGNNTYTGLILMEGNLNVSGQLSADALYSAKGDIADLAVDKLSTSRRIVKYLAGDTGDDNYIRAENEQLAFVSGVYAEGTEQATTPDGLALYWEQDITDATLGTDGYPYVDGVRVFTTTGVTDWPVTVYTYTELVKAQMAFEQDDAGNYAPVLTLGAGDGNGYNKLRMAKGVNGLEMLYTATSGKEIGITMSEDGYTDIIGQRAVTAISVTEGADGSVTVVNTLEGDVSEEIVITPDDNGDPATLTYNGVDIPITWTEASE